MANDREMLETIKSQVLALLVQVTERPQPSYEIDGQRVSWGEYFEQLQASVTWCEERLSGAEPFEFRTQGVPE